MYDDDDSARSDSRVSALFHDSTHHIEPDVPALVVAGVERGRVKRRRQSIGTAFASALAVAAVAGIAVGVAPNLGGAGSEPAAAAGPAASSASSAKPTAKPTTLPSTKPKSLPDGGKPSGLAPQPPPTANLPVRAAQLPGLFTQLYPGKVTPAEERTGRIMDDGKKGQYAHFLWKGYTTSVLLVPYAGTPEQRCRELQAGSGKSVNCKPRPDGTILQTGREVAPAVDGGGSVHWATLLTKHGYEITVLSYNTATKEGPLLAPKPPFTIAQLTAAVTSQVWY